MLLPLVLLSIVTAVSTHDQLVFNLPLDAAEYRSPGQLPRPRVAIIGGGAAGTSSAYFLGFLGTQEPSLACDIDLFESNDYLGGRSTTVQPFDSYDESLTSIELGGSIFVKVNKNIWKAVDTFNLTLQEGHGGGSDYLNEMGIWDGEHFVYRENPHSDNDKKMGRRYGRSPVTAGNAVQNTVSSFINLYSKEFQSKGPHEGIREYMEGLGLGGLTGTTTLEYLKSLGVRDLFIKEVVAATTRVNYGQDPSHLHACESFLKLDCC